MHKISLIIPIYNQEKYLEECLNCVLSQTLSEIEILCINDGSTDSSIDIINEFIEKDSRIKLINQKNQGVAIARNNGIKEAKGEFIAFLDPDDFYPENDVLETLYNKATENNVLIAGGSIWDLNVYTGEWLKDHTQKFYEGLNFHEDKLMDYKDYQFDYGYYRFIYNREFLITNDIKFPPLKRYQDIPFFINAMTLAKKFYAIEKCTYCYRWQGKDINWKDSTRIEDLLKGITFELNWSKKNNLSKLHRLTFEGRLNGEYKQKLIENINFNIKNIKLLIDLKSSINYNLLEKEDCELKNEITINNILKENYNTKLKRYAQSLFSLQNENNHKILTVCGIKLKIKQTKASNISIAFATKDDEYVDYMLVTIESILKSAYRKTNMDFYIFVPDVFSEKTKKNIQIVTKKYKNAKFHFIDVKNSFENIELTHDFISYPTYYRLLMPTMLPITVDKCFYFDTDVIVKKDLTEYYNIDLQDYYFAGVKAAGYLFDKKYTQNRLNIKDASGYSNAGVILMNLKKMREDNIAKEFDNLLDRKFHDQDQDILNIACLNKIKHMPLKYNMMTKYENMWNDCIANGAYSETEIQEALKTPVIIHYADRIKPWDSKKILFSKYWWESAKRTNCYNRILYKYLKNQIKNLFFPPQNELQFHEQIFSIKNEYNNDKKYKIFRLFGFKLTISKRVN